MFSSSRANLSSLTYKKGPYPGMPSKVMGMYILLADDTEPGIHSNNGDWEPLLHPYQQAGSNVLFFTFINPATMDVPLAFRKLAATRGKNTEGSIPLDTLVIFAIGGLPAGEMTMVLMVLILILRRVQEGRRLLVQIWCIL